MAGLIGALPYSPAVFKTLQVVRNTAGVITSTRIDPSPTQLAFPQGDQVWIYDLKADVHRLRLLLEEHELIRANFIQGDVADVDGLKRAFQEHAITHVVHLAGLQVPVCRSDPLLGARVNVLGTLAVFEAVRHLKDQIQRLVYASSAAVFPGSAVVQSAWPCTRNRPWASQGPPAKMG